MNVTLSVWQQHLFSPPLFSLLQVQLSAVSPPPSAPAVPTSLEDALSGLSISTGPPTMPSELQTGISQCRLCEWSHTPVEWLCVERILVPSPTSPLNPFRPKAPDRTTTSNLSVSSGADRIANIYKSSISQPLKQMETWIKNFWQLKHFTFILNDCFFPTLNEHLKRTH